MARPKKATCPDCGLPVTLARTPIGLRYRHRTGDRVRHERAVAAKAEAMARAAILAEKRKARP